MTIRGFVVVVAMFVMVLAAGFVVGDAYGQWRAQQNALAALGRM
jgi:hypothetical protein